MTTTEYRDGPATIPTDWDQLHTASEADDPVMTATDLAMTLAAVVVAFALVAGAVWGVVSLVSGLIAWLA